MVTGTRGGGGMDARSSEPGAARDPSSAPTGRKFDGSFVVIATQCEAGMIPTNDGPMSDGGLNACVSPGRSDAADGIMAADDGGEGTPGKSCEAPLGSGEV